MAHAKLTLIGCRAFFENANDDLFKNLLLPEGIDKKTLIENITLKGGEFEVLYANPYYLQSAIGTWSAVQHDTFKRWIDALSIKYAPLENYDRTEDWTDTTDRDSTGTSQSSSQSTSDTDTTDENTKSAYDSSVYQPNEKNEGTSQNETSASDSTTVNNSDDITAEHHGHVHGNIGVTTSQQMLQSELDLGYWNIYNKITELFVEEFLIPVYV